MNKEVQKIIFSCFFIFLTKNTFATDSNYIDSPTNFRATLSDGKIYLSWAHSSSGGGEMIMAKKSYTASNLSLRSQTYKFQVDLARNELPFYSSLTESLSSKSYQYFTNPSDFAYQFRVRAIKYEPGALKPIYSSYTYSKLILTKPRLNKPSITPISNEIIKNQDEISINSNQIVNLQYQLIGSHRSCSHDNAWTNYTAPFTLEKSYKVCARAIKTGHPRSEISTNNFTVILGIKVLYIHTDLLGSPVAETYKQF
ncbi:MAG: hypothetical protein MK175_00055 [Pseudoalteromonas sp.]|uniref:hypothetical protein n=1 Tax=Pseudoalteromonas sp. TaxID=53249 RepID=UPI0025E0D9AA|nr:hypothetical protein [Pseudoalteromonas sp.]MCH2085548.1 hypothetical protein [Pseudoalteromonas sp.]